jgi:cation:H+ antiporter
VAVDLLVVFAGLVVLARGADVFVVSAARLAATLGLSPVVIGAVVVGFGTGVPELLVSSSAAARGSLDLAAGNVVGSNLANLTLVLGVAGIIARPEAVPRVLRREAPLSLASVALFAMLLQGGLSRAEGFVLCAGLIVATLLMLRSTEAVATDVRTAEEAAAVEALVDEVEEFVDEDDEEALAGPQKSASARMDILRVALGLTATVAGAHLLVGGARSIATELGLAGGFVGLTVVAIGTSLPELVTAVQSARRDETALLVGNVLGSNVFNSTAVAGSAALIGPSVIDDAGLTLLAASSMVLVAALAWLFLGLGGRLRRWEAFVLIGVYGVTLPLAG